LTAIASDARTPQLTRPVTAVVIGAGDRGSIYARFAEAHPELLRIVGVADVNSSHRERMAQDYAIDRQHVFETWENLLGQPRFADACIIATPDHLHYGPALAAMDKGYDLLLEKPIAQSWEQCQEIGAKAAALGRIVGVSHVLRYAPYFRELKRIVRSGEIGDVVSIQHLEPVDFQHMAHAFVRGPWKDSASSNPMILAKSCHDLDLIRWLADAPCLRVSSFGGLSLFRPEQAPAGAPLRCTDGCPVESTCAFSAIRMYGSRQAEMFMHHLDLKDDTDASIQEALETGPYGRCVYHCDNDVVDAQVVNLDFEGGVTASFSMQGLATYEGRRTRVFGTAGDIVGDEQTLRTTPFLTWETTTWDLDLDGGGADSGHSGGDFGLMRSWVQAIGHQDPSYLSSTVEEMMESHHIGFLAEESRLAAGRVLSL
jgi:predicted dehydrogenase